MTADSSQGNVSFDDRLRTIEDELRTPWTLLTASLEELAGSIVDVDGRAAIERARRSAARMQQVAEAFFTGSAVPAASAGGEALRGTPADVGGGRLRVLIADDNADLRAYLATMLAAKYSVDTVSDGAALVAAALSQRPDIIVTDARMPFIDGIEAARLLREDTRTADIPIVLLSGSGGDEAAGAAVDAGVDDYLVKPFTIAELIARVDALARRRLAFRESADAGAGDDVRSWRLLAAAAERFVGITRSARVLDALGDIVVPALGDWYKAYFLEGDVIRLKSVVHRQPAKRDFAWMLEREYPHAVGDGTTIDRAIATGKTVTSLITPESIAAHGRGPSHGAILVALQYHSAVAIPFVVAGEVLGGILVLGSERRPRVAAKEVAVLERLVERAATAYHAATLAERSPSMASGLQRALLPGTLPAVEGLDVSVAYAAAAREDRIGGDWYDAMTLGDGRILLSIGDVAGHGLDASISMAVLRGAIRSAAREDPHPGTILAAVNGVLRREHPGRQATALVAILEPLSLDVTIASAGHIPPAILDPRGEITHPAASGAVLGAGELARYDDVEFRLEPGSSMLFYTKGLGNGDNADAALPRIASALSACASKSDDLAGAVCRALLGDDAPPEDVALLAVTASATLDRLDLTLPAEPENAVRARTAIARFLNGVGMADRVGDLLVAAGEAIGNAIEHAYQGQCGALRVRGRATADSVTVEIRDFGAWHSDVAVEGRGFGLPLMRAFADAVEVERTPFGTRVELLANRAL
jgi:CheY-like chemotaxis protein/anti-sigma regulatory factor (Ser/Thr protein kinase)